MIAHAGSLGSELPQIKMEKTCFSLHEKETVCHKLDWIQSTKEGSKSNVTRENDKL